MLRKPFFFRAGAAAIGIILLTSAYHRLSSSSLMAETANRFLASLTPVERAKATFTFEEEERQNWHFVPIERKGLALREMTPAQKHLATALLAAGLSQQGYVKAETIMSLEDVLRIIEHGTGPERDPEKYYVSIFGEPSADGAWGYRVEGHHLRDKDAAHGRAEPPHVLFPIVREFISDNMLEMTRILFFIAQKPGYRCFDLKRHGFLLLFSPE